jgi:hypothetical protein
MDATDSSMSGVVIPTNTKPKNLSQKRKVKVLPVALTKLTDKDWTKFQLVLEVDNNNKQVLHMEKSFWLPSWSCYLV